MAKSAELSVTISVETPLCPYGIAYRRIYGISTSGFSKKSLNTPLYGGVTGLER
jgi:hypothetical protein